MIKLTQITILAAVTLAASSLSAQAALSRNSMTARLAFTPTPTLSSVRVGIEYSYGHVDPKQYGLPDPAAQGLPPYSQFTTFSSYSVRNGDAVFAASHVLSGGEQESANAIFIVEGLDASEIKSLALSHPFNNWGQVTMNHNCTAGVGSCGIVLPIGYDSWAQKTLQTGTYYLTATYQNGSIRVLQFTVTSDSSGQGLGMIP